MLKTGNTRRTIFSAGSEMLWKKQRPVLQWHSCSWAKSKNTGRTGIFASAFHLSLCYFVGLGRVKNAEVLLWCKLLSVFPFLSAVTHWELGRGGGRYRGTKDQKSGLSWNVINILLSADLRTGMWNPLEKLSLIVAEVFHWTCGRVVGKGS